MYKSDSKLIFWPYFLKSIPFWQFMWEEKKVSLGHSSCHAQTGVLSILDHHMKGVFLATPRQSLYRLRHEGTFQVLLVILNKNAIAEKSSNFGPLDYSHVSSNIQNYYAWVSQISLGTR